MLSGRLRRMSLMVVLCRVRLSCRVCLMCLRMREFVVRTVIGLVARRRMRSMLLRRWEWFLVARGLDLRGPFMLGMGASRVRVRDGRVRLLNAMLILCRVVTCLDITTRRLRFESRLDTDGSFCPNVEVGVFSA